jgi:hypothetical protein
VRHGVPDQAVVHAGVGLDQVDARLQPSDAEPRRRTARAPAWARRGVALEQDEAAIDLAQRTELRRRERRRRFRVHFPDLARRQDAIVHHDEHAAAARSGGGGDAHRGQQVRRPVPAGIRDGAHRADQHDRLVRQQYEIEQIGRLLDRVRAVRDDQARDVVALEPVRRMACEPPHLLRRHVRARQAREVVDGDRTDRVEAGHLREDVFSAEGGHGRTGRGIELHGDRPAGEDERDHQPSTSRYLRAPPVLNTTTE